MAMSKDDLHQLIEELPDAEVHAAARYIQFLWTNRDPFIQALLEAPLDDEAETEEEQNAADEAWQEYLDGKARPWAEVREELTRDK